jgi:hypothetical protein
MRLAQAAAAVDEQDMGCVLGTFGQAARGRVGQLVAGPNDEGVEAVSQDTVSPLAGR